MAHRAAHARSSTMKRPLLFALLAVAAGGCGRTSLLGDGGEGGCPPGEVLVDGVGVPKGFDGGLFDFSHPDGFNRDGFGGGDGFGDMSSCTSQPEICDNKKDDNCNGLV